MQTIKNNKAIEIEDLPVLQVQRREYQPFMAGKGSLSRSDNCLILKPSSSTYKVLFLTTTKPDLNINCFGLTETEFELLFTVNIFEILKTEDLSFRCFLTNTVNFESEILVTKHQEEVFGLSIDLNRKSIFLKRKIMKKLLFNHITTIRNCLINSPIKSLSHLSIGIRENLPHISFKNKENLSVRVLVCHSRTVNQIMNLDHFLRSETLSKAKIDSFMIKLNERKNKQCSDNCCLIFTSSKSVLVLRVNLRMKKVTRKARITLEEVLDSANIKVGSDMSLRRKLRMGKPIFNPNDNSMIIIIGEAEKENWMGFGPKCFLVKVEDAFTASNLRKYLGVSQFGGWYH